jgi:ABC-type transport system involved in multi-copper enzyme maturation permease subunit
MVSKELLENRWKFIAGTILALAVGLSVAFSFELVRNLLSNANTTQLPEALTRQIGNLSSYEAYVWSMWFGKSGVQLVLILAVLLGAPLIAGEVSTGSIFFLLSRPLSRTRILGFKYVTSAAILLCIALVGSAALYIAAALQGHAQHLGGILASTLLMWLASLFVLGSALIFSVLLSDSVRAFAATGGVMAVVAISTLIPGVDRWTPAYYWSSLPAYLGVEFPTQALLINLLAAVLPLALALFLFRTRQY